MLFRVDPASPVGLAEQIAAQVRGALAIGSVTGGDRLPPARQLATGLGINMHTVLRAYAMLRDEQLIELRRGRGAQIRSGVSAGRVALDEQIRALVRSARDLGVGPAELAAQIRESTA